MNFLRIPPRFEVYSSLFVLLLNSETFLRTPTLSIPPDRTWGDLLLNPGRRIRRRSTAVRMNSDLLHSHYVEPLYE